MCWKHYYGRGLYYEVTPYVVRERLYCEYNKDMQRNIFKLLNRLHLVSKITLEQKLHNYKEDLAFLDIENVRYVDYSK